MGFRGRARESRLALPEASLGDKRSRSPPQPGFHGDRDRGGALAELL